ncbi:MAG: sulfite exporter TauE/SafE family protein, partial [Mailhella sp.]|nr:sulfite exporter TauE/SafE family protein [Mailhella sp.]
MTACILVALSWFLASTAASAAGVGVVMLSTPIVSLLVPPAQAVLIACLVSSVWVLMQAVSYRKSIDFSNVMLLGIGSLPGCAAGAMVLKLAPMPVLELCVAAMIALFLLLQAI